VRCSAASSGRLDLSSRTPRLSWAVGFSGSIISACSRYGRACLDHPASAKILIHRVDWPVDVSFVIDQIEAATLLVPTAFLGSIDLTQIGHIGHSFGGHTAISLAGENFAYGNLSDTRVDAVVVLSPMGPGQLGLFDNGPSDNSWVDIAIPV